MGIYDLTPHIKNVNLAQLKTVMTKIDQENLEVTEFSSK